MNALEGSIQQIIAQYTGEFRFITLCAGAPHEKSGSFLWHACMLKVDRIWCQYVPHHKALLHHADSSPQEVCEYVDQILRTKAARVGVQFAEADQIPEMAQVLHNRDLVVALRHSERTVCTPGQRAIIDARPADGNMAIHWQRCADMLRTQLPRDAFRTIHLANAPARQQLLALPHELWHFGTMRSIYLSGHPIDQLPEQIYNSYELSCCSTQVQELPECSERSALKGIDLTGSPIQRLPPGLQRSLSPDRTTMNPRNRWDAMTSPSAMKKWSSVLVLTNLILAGPLVISIYFSSVLLTYVLGALFLICFTAYFLLRCLRASLHNSRFQETAEDLSMPPPLRIPLPPALPYPFSPLLLPEVEEKKG